MNNQKKNKNLTERNTELTRRLTKMLKTMEAFLVLLFTIIFSQTIAAQAATYTVMNTFDNGAGSLRDAVEQANASAEDDTINFAIPATDTGCVNGVCTITLTSGQLSIENNGKLTINGTGADKLAVSGNNSSRVFVIKSDATAAISGLTITGGSIGSRIGSGGGIYNNQGGTLTITNSTVSDNSATGFGGIYKRDGSTFNSRNSIIANSTGGDCSNVGRGTFSLEFTLIEDGSCGASDGTDGNLTGDPVLGPLQDNGGPTMTHALLPGSIAINAGSNALAVDENGQPLATDQRGAGYPRIVEGMVDLGSFEVQIDSDGDGVTDGLDLCPGTVLPEPRPAELKKNRFYADADGNFVDGEGTLSGITVSDTYGCSASQIIEAAGLGTAHTRFGITRSALLDWIAAH